MGCTCKAPGSMWVYPCYLGGMHAIIQWPNSSIHYGVLILKMAPPFLAGSCYQNILGFVTIIFFFFSLILIIFLYIFKITFSFIFLLNFIHVFFIATYFIQIIISINLIIYFFIIIFIKIFFLSLDILLFYSIFLHGYLDLMCQVISFVF